MDPLNDDELNELLLQWRTPPAPKSLDSRVRARARPSGWRWLLRGKIALPVPIGALLIATIITLAAMAFEPAPSETPGTPVEFSNFELVEDLNPRIVRNSSVQD